MPKYDVAIVGAGLGGLAAAALLSGRKKKIIVLECGGTVDGAGGVFIKDGIAFFAAPTLSYGFEPGGAFNELSALLGITQKTAIHSPSYQVALPDRRITIYPEWSDTLEELRREFPREIDAIIRFHNDLHKEAGKNAKSRIWSYLSRHRPVAGFLRKYRFSRELMTFYDVQSLFFYQKPAEELSLASLTALCDAPPHTIHEGFIKLSEQLHAVILREGGEIRFNEPVSELALKNDRVIGLTTTRGVVHANTVLLNSAHRRISSALFVSLKKDVIPIGMCDQVLFLPDYARPHDYISLSLNAEGDSIAPPGIRTLCASFGLQQNTASDTRALITKISRIMPFLDNYLVFAEERQFERREAALPEGVSFKRLRGTDGTPLLFRGNRKNVYLLSNEHTAPLQVLSAAHRFVRTVR